jgi:Zn-dependent M28 family amino/carboxypeptidase
MNRYFLILPLFALLTACNEPESTAQQTDFSVVRSSEILKALSADSMNGRSAMTDDIWKASDFIASEFEAIGLQPLPGEDDYLQRFSTETRRNQGTEIEMANVGGMIKGKREHEIVIFSAHYDHIGVRQPVEGDSIANGANDNASGVTAVIELARYFAAQDQPERTLFFVGFTAEEMGGYGSRYFSRQFNPDSIVAMFNIEMIGKPAVEGPNTAWITGFDRSTFGELLQKSTEGTEYEFYPDPYPSQNLFYRSDNATLARLGVPAHTISTTPIDVDKDYHRVTDEFETLNVEHLTNTIRAISRAAEGIVSGLDTPSRVDTTQVR